MPSFHWRRRLARLGNSRLSGVFACALAFALATLRLDAKAIWWDESLSLLRAQSTLATILSGSITFGGLETVDQHPPLYFAALAGVRALAGESELALRVLSALAAVVTVAVTWALARRLLGGQVAGLSALLVAASPLLIWYGQEARMYTLATLCAVVALYAGLRAAATREWRWAVAALLATAAAAATHYLTVLFVLPALLAIALLLQRRGSQGAGRSELPRLALASGAVLAIALGVAAAIIRRLPPEAVYDQPALSLGAMLVDAINSYSLGLSVNLRSVWWIDLVFALVWISGGASLALPAVSGRWRGLRAARARRFVLLVALVLTPILAIWLLTRRLPFYINSRYVMFAMPLFAIGLARGLTCTGRLPALRWLLAAGMVASMGWSLHRYYIDPYYASKEDYRGAAQEVMSKELPEDLLLVNGPESQAAFEHYYAGKLAVIGLPDMRVRPWDLDSALPEALKGRKRVWVVQARHHFTDPDRVLLDWFDEHTIKVSTKTFESSGALVSVRLYLVDDPVEIATTPSPAPLALAGPAQLLHAQAIVWGDTPAPLSSMAGQSPAIASPAGDALAARLTWALVDPTPDLKVSLRLVRAGLVWVQRDARPIERLPSSVWPEDARVTHTLDLQIPAGLPPALYELQVWVYDGQTGASWPLTQAGQPAQSHLSLAMVQIEPPATRALSWRAPLATLMAPTWGHWRDAVRLEGASDLPERVSPGEPLLLQASWRSSSDLGDDRQIVINWLGADGQVRSSASLPLLGPGPVSASASQASLVETLYPLAAPDEPGDYTLHLLVYDSARQRFLPSHRGPLPALGRDLTLGRVTVTP